MGNSGGGGGSRQDSIRSGYVSDHEALGVGVGVVRGGGGGGVVRQQVSIDSVQSHDSRLCYLTSSEVSQKVGTSDGACVVCNAACNCRTSQGRLLSPSVSVNRTQYYNIACTAYCF